MTQASDTTPQTDEPVSTGYLDIIDEPTVQTNEPEPATEPDDPAEPEKSDLERWCEAETAWLEAPLTKWVRAENIWKYRSVEFDWTHTIEAYEGDCLGVRIPSQAALTAFQLGTGLGSPDDTRQAMTIMFIQRHLSPRSYLHVFGRMMDPNDDYTDEKLGALMTMLVTKSTEAIMAEHKAKAEAERAAKAG